MLYQSTLIRDNAPPVNKTPPHTLIHGRRRTGKTTLAQELKNQYLADGYNVFLVEDKQVLDADIIEKLKHHMLNSHCITAVIVCVQSWRGSLSKYVYHLHDYPWQHQYELVTVWARRPDPTSKTVHVPNYFDVPRNSDATQS